MLVEIYFDDLTPEAQERVLEEGFHGDLGNYDVFPIAYVGEEDEDDDIDFDEEDEEDDNWDDPEDRGGWDGPWEEINTHW